MIAAVYARKSTAQADADADSTSVARQIESARSFANGRGWAVQDVHIYSDTATSGAETRKLINRERLLGAIASDPLPFQVLIMRDASRFSRRDGDEAFGELKRLAQRGVTVWFYQDGTCFEYGNFAANITGIVRAEMNAEYRRQIGKLTREAMMRKARAGHVTGGRVFGYENFRVEGHVERRINEPEAAVVRQIFALCASGTGYTRIAKQLNSERAIAPRPQQSRPSGWSPSTVREVLHRPLYRGEVLWNQTQKRDAEGKTAPAPRPEEQWLRVQRPDLRIVSEDVWNAAHRRLSGIRARLASARGDGFMVRRDIDSKYFLSGFARCGTCGGTLSALSRSHGGRRAFFYGCLAHSKRGAEVCDNALVLPVERVDAAVLSKLVGDVLRPQVVRALIDGIFDAIKSSTVATDCGALRIELARLDQKIRNLTDAVENGGTVAPLVKKLQERQAERETVLAAIAASEAVGRLAPDRAEVERTVMAKISGWRRLLTTKGPRQDQGRQVLRELLDGPIRFSPMGRQYEFHADVTTGDLIAGLVGIPPLMASPTIPSWNQIAAFLESMRVLRDSSGLSA